MVPDDRNDVENRTILFSLSKMETRPESYEVKAMALAFTLFLAHRSRRLIGKLIGYSWYGVRPSVRPFTMHKDLLQNGLANQSQILCVASLGRGNESLFAASGSHDQDGRHAHIW